MRTQAAGSRDRGQIVPLFAMSLVVMLLFVGLVIDGGSAFVNRREAQNVADTGSLAGAKVIADFYLGGGTKPDLTPYTSADIYAAIELNVEAANGCLVDGGTPCVWSAHYVNAAEVVLGAVVDAASAIPVNTSGVAVTVEREPRTFFLGVIGQGSWDVAAAATAMTSGQAQQAISGQLLPIALATGDYTAGVEYTLQTPSGPGGGGGGGPSWGPGNFGWLSWTGDNSATALTASVCTPNNPPLELPEWVEGSTGTVNNKAVRNCLAGYRDAGTVVLVPIVEQCAPCNGTHAEFLVVGVAAFVLTDFSQPAISSLTGRFLEYYPLSSIPAGTITFPTPGDFTVQVMLVR